MRKIIAAGIILGLSSSLQAGYYGYRHGGSDVALGVGLASSGLFNAIATSNAVKAASNNQQENLRISLEQIEKVREATATEFQKTEDRLKKMTNYLKKLNKRIERAEKKLGITQKEGESNE